jgi:hypothetical protein
VGAGAAVGGVGSVTSGGIDGARALAAHREAA